MPANNHDQITDSQGVAGHSLNFGVTFLTAQESKRRLTLLASRKTVHITGSHLHATLAVKHAQS